MPQDMPPTGGYEPVQYRRNLPVRGFRPAYYLLGVGVVMTYGFWRMGKGIREQKYVYTILQEGEGLGKWANGLAVSWRGRRCGRGFT